MDSGSINLGSSPSPAATLGAVSGDREGSKNRHFGDFLVEYDNETISRIIR